MSKGLSISVKNVYALEVNFTSAEEASYHLEIVSKKGNKITSSPVHSGPLDKPLKKLIKRDYPVVLILRGSQIVTRKLDNIIDPTPKLALNALLSNSDLEVFDIQYVKLGQGLLASAIRKDRLNEVLNTIPRKNIVVDTYIGDGVLGSLALLKEEDNVHVHNYVFSKKNDQIDDFLIEESSQDLKLGDDQISPESIPCYSAALNYFTGILDQQSSLDEQIEINNGEQKDKQLFITLKIAGLLIILVAILGNMYVVDELNQDIQAAQLAQNDKIDKIEHNKSLASQIAVKQQFLNLSGMHLQGSFAYYADVIAASTPTEILLTNLNFDGLSGNFKSKKQLKFSRNKIEISGRCHEAQIVNNWLDTIKTYAWVEEAVISNYEEDRRSNYSEFTIELKVNGILE